MGRPAKGAAIESARKSFRIPLVGSFQNRSGSDTSKDQRFVNCYAESKKTETTENKKIWLIKRPGLSSVRTYTAGTSRGVHYWNGSTYAAVGNKIYKDGTALITINGTSGHVGFEICTTDAYGDCLFAADGTDCYLIKSSGSYVTVPTSYSDWVTLTAYADGDFVVPTTKNGYYYECVTAGTTGAAEPTWPVAIGQQTAVDGTAVWRCSGYYGIAYGTRANTTAYAVGAQVVPGTANGYYYECTTAGTTAGALPVLTQTIGYTTTDGTVVWTCKGLTTSAEPLPKDHLPYPVFMDGYIFIAAKKADGSNSSLIYNSDIDNPLSWNQVDFISAESFPDNLVALARQNNILMAFGDYTTEMFNDAGNATGSPLARNESIMLQVGCAAPESIMQQEKFVVFVGQSDTGGRAVWLVDGFKPTKVSDEAIERIIDAQGASITAARGYGVRTNGHLFYVLGLSGRTLVYDLEEKMWHEWSTNSNGTHTAFTGVYAADDGTGKMLLLGSTDATLYRLDNTLYKDVNNNILVDIYTNRLDYESMKRKFMSNVSLIGDQKSGQTITIRWSDDDYTTYNTGRVASLTSRTFITNLGSFRRRSFNIQYTGNTALRLEGMEMEVILGSH